MIPGRVWSRAFKQWMPHAGYFEAWAWDVNLGVALSIAGALTAAYKEGWGECWEHHTGQQYPGDKYQLR